MASEEYKVALAKAQHHHRRSKTYSGKLLRPHKAFLIDLIARLGIKSALDYGCGKGDQYHWRDPEDGKTLAESFGFMPALYDPAWPPFAKLPKGTFDLVICTHVLGSIPVKDLPWVMDLMLDRADKALFVAEKIGRIKKTVFGDRKGMPNDYEAKDWLALMEGHRRDGIELHLSATKRFDDGMKINERFAL